MSKAGEAVASLIAILSLGACVEKDETYFPLQEDLAWEYQITVQDMDLITKHRYYVINKGREQVDGIDVYIRDVNDGIITYLEKTDQGIRRVGMKKKLDINTRFDKEDHFVLAYPLKVGTQWQQETITSVLEVVIAPFRRHYALHAPVTMQYTIASLEEKIKVPVGSFNNCITVKGYGKTKADADKSLGTLHIEVNSTDWYCPDAGLVKSERIESTDSRVLVRGSFLMELEKFVSD